MTKSTKDSAVEWLVRLSVASGVVWTAVSEWQLARIIGAPSWVAPALPIAIDAYVIAAVRSGRRSDLAGALAIMSCAQIAARLLDAGQVQVSVALVAFVSVLVPLTIWRVHALADKNHEPEPARTITANQAAQIPLNPVQAAPANPANQVQPVVPNQVQAGPATGPNLTRNQLAKKPKPKAAPSKPTNPGTPSALDQVQQILDLIEGAGFDNVKLDMVMDETGLKKTTAYNRLVEARTTWQQAHP